MRPVPIALRAVLAVAVVALVGGFGAPAAAEPRTVSVTAEGVSFSSDRAESDDDVIYEIRRPDSSGVFGTDWLREELDRDDVRAGYHAFEKAWDELPEGYCVVYVRVQGVGEWREDRGHTACTATPSPTPSAAASPTVSSSPKPSKSASSTASPTPKPATAESPSSPSPSPSPSASPSASASPSKGSRSPSPDAMAEQGEALTRSFSGELPELSAPPADRDQRRGWVAVGLIVAAVTATGAGAALWWGQRKG